MSSIITFYSFKGGVGRSMALANVAFELAKKGKKVLMVDWDLEAPGLEKYFSGLSIEIQGDGLLRLLHELQRGGTTDYANYLWTIRTSHKLPLYLLPSGRDKDPAQYLSDLEKFDWEVFFSQNNGGLQLENLRNRWLNDFDFVLIDSRTGLSDSSGLCTIMMPDVLVPIFTANYQSLYGIRDIVKYIQAARQNLKVDRMALLILPVPARFGTRVEFKESQDWLDRMADILRETFNNWLPKWIEPRYILEQIKIPQIDYYSFGEKLAAAEQGANDPEGIAFVYSKLASLLASNFKDVESLVGSEYFQSRKVEYEKVNSLDKTRATSQYQYDIFISYSRPFYSWVRELLFPALTEYLNDELGYNPQIFMDSTEIVAGESWTDRIEKAVLKSKTLLIVISESDPKYNFLDFALTSFLNRAPASSNNVFALRTSPSLPNSLPAGIEKRMIADFSGFNFDETTKRTKLRVEFGLQVHNLAIAIAHSIKLISQQETISKPIVDNQLEVQEKLVQLAKEYDNIRKSMPSSDLRTQLMENIVTQMKSVVTEPTDLLNNFTKSSFPGERLAAISILQKFPNISYIDWLSNHVGDIEKPFIGYQASVALYIAARTFGKTNKKDMKETLEKAMQNVNKFEYKDPNQINTLKEAKMELERR